MLEGTPCPFPNRRTRNVISPDVIRTNSNGRPRTIAGTVRNRPLENHFRQHGEAESQYGTKWWRPMPFQPRLGGDVLEREIENAAGGEQHDCAKGGIVTGKPEPADQATEGAQQGKQHDRSLGNQ